MKTPTNCPNCGSGGFLWHCTAVNQGSAQDGRIRMSEVGVLFFLGCEACSETVMKVSADEMMAHINKNRIFGLGIAV